MVFCSYWPANGRRGHKQRESCPNGVAIMSQRSPLARGFLKRCDLPGVFLFPLAARPSGAALCRLSATFAHPNAYPSMNYGAFLAGKLSMKPLFKLPY